MKVLREYWNPAAILILSGILLHDHVAPQAMPVHGPAVNGVALGKSFAPILASAYADSWSAAAKALEEGKTVAQAQAILQETWKEGRVRVFMAEVAPSFATVLPEGGEPTTPDRRAQVVDLWKSFARGLRGGR